MKKKIFITLIVIISLFTYSCSQLIVKGPDTSIILVKTGLDILFEKHFDKIAGKNIALVTNHSGLNNNGKSNVEIFLSYENVNLVKILTPEHGFTGNLSAGTKIEYDSSETGFPQIISLYGINRKPTIEMLDEIDLIIYDIQDIGARFYTYISTLGLVMETAAEANIPIMVLDRPNPIGNKVEGPLLNEDYQSFVGKYPIPIRYGLTVGEFASMIVGENMINSTPNLTVIPMENYNKNQYYDETNLIWKKPSPNIPDLETSIIYPGLCLIEATNVSEGRGTYSPFKQIGAPWIDANELSELLNDQNLNGANFKPIEFMPISISDMSKYPKYENEKCYGIEITITNRDEYKSILTGVTVLWAINKLYSNTLKINQESLARLWGSESLYEQLMEGKNPKQIVQSYQTELDRIIQIRDKYRLY